jgi:hypothetical protein
VATIDELKQALIEAYDRAEDAVNRAVEARQRGDDAAARRLMVEWQWAYAEFVELNEKLQKMLNESKQQPTELEAPEIEADTAEIFEVHSLDVQSLDCQELNRLLSEIDYFMPLLQDAELHHVKTVNIVTVKGTGVSVDVSNALGFLRGARQAILSEISRKCQ